MQTKYDAIEHFEFMKKVYNKVAHAGFINNQGEEIDLCGVFFNKEYAYSCNRHIIGRVRINDNLPVEKPIFWRFNDKEYENVAAKFLLNMKGYCKPSNDFNQVFDERFSGNIDLFFTKSSECCFFFKRDMLLKILDDIYGEKEVAKIKTNVSIVVTSEYEISLDFQPVKPTPKNQPVKIVMPLFTNLSQMHNIRLITTPCTINVFYLHNILKYSFFNEQNIGLKYSLERRVPVVLFNKKNDIFWAIAQKI